MPSMTLVPKKAGLVLEINLLAINFPLASAEDSSSTPCAVEDSSSTRSERFTSSGSTGGGVAVTVNVNESPSATPSEPASEEISSSRSSLRIVPVAAMEEGAPGKAVSPSVPVTEEIVNVNVSFSSFTASAQISTDIMTPSRLALSPLICPVPEGYAPTGLEVSQKSARSAVSPVSLDTAQLKLTVLPAVGIKVVSFTSNLTTNSSSIAGKGLITIRSSSSIVISANAPGRILTPRGTVV